MPARSPEECDRLFEAYVNDGDLDALVALYDPAGGLAQRDGSVASGHAAIRANFARLVAMRPRISVEVVRVVRAGDLAMIYSDWSLSVPGPEGQPTRREGKAIEVVRRGPDGSWRVVLDDPFARG